MTHPRPRDTRDEVDGVVQRHQLDYSLAQLRLVGLLLLTVELGTLLLAGGFASFEVPLVRLSGVIGFSQTLPLLPLGFALYLVGGGHRRHRREQPWTGALHQVLLPLGLIVLVLLPVVTIQDATSLATDRRQAVKEIEERLANRQQNIERVQTARSAADIARLGGAQGLTVPAAPGEPKAVGLWRYEVSLERQRREEDAVAERLSRSLFHQDLLNPVRLITTLMLQGISGIGLLLLWRQGRRQIKRMGLTPALFFRTDATGPVQKHRHR
ncbi:MAG: hypothetical protein QUV07_14715 [Cyanobium sp. CZS 25K]|nr:hypothetical protein [Cyanobium sp. CZS25K]